jgi:hypothetical protein
MKFAGEEFILIKKNRVNPETSFYTGCNDHE